MAVGDASTSAVRPSLSGRGLFWLLAVALWALGAAWFFREWWSSGFDRVVGDTGDSRLLIFLLEHWFDVFAGKQHWRDPPMFYPTPGVLGYSDAMFLFGLINAPLRLAGADPVAAFQWTLVISSLIGFSGFVWLAHRLWRLPALVVLPCAMIFAFANNIYQLANHGQLFAVHFVPWLLGAATLAIAWRERRPLAAVAAAAMFGAGCALLLFTSYYVGWFFGFALALFAAIYAVVDRRALVTHLRRRTGPPLAVGTATLAAFTMAIVPFLITYLPHASDGSGRPAEGVADSVPDTAIYTMGVPQDLWNLGPDHLLWGWALRALPPALMPDLNDGEHSLAITPLVAIVSLAFFFGLLVRRWRITDSGRIDAAFIAAGLTALILVALSIRYGGFAFWTTLREVIPGAGVMRPTYRSQLITGTIACIALAFALQRFHAWIRTRFTPAIATAGVAALAGLLVVEQVNLEPVTHLSRSEQLRSVARIGPVPDHCEVFHFAKPDEANMHHVERNSEATFVAAMIDLPTMHGYSRLSPDDWALTNLFDVDPANRALYDARIAEHLDRHGLHDTACALDPKTFAWR